MKEGPEYLFELGEALGEGFTVLGLKTGQYRMEGSVLMIKDEAKSRVTWVSAGAGGALEETVKNAFTLALGEGSAAKVSLGYLNDTLDVYKRQDLLRLGEPPPGVRCGNQE